MQRNFAASIAVAAAASVPTVPLGDSGVDMPMVVVGTFQLNETEAYGAVKNALSVGFTGAHCDWTYFNMPGCGKALKEVFDGGLAREDLYLQASVGGFGYWWDHFPNGTSAAGGTKIQLDETFQQLQVEYLDHVFLHMPPQSMLAHGTCSAAEDAGEKTCTEMLDQWRVMEEYYKAGKIRSLGVSNFCPDCFGCLEDVEVQPVLNQLQMHVGWGKDMLGIWTDNKKRGVVPQAYSPLGHGSELDPEVLHGNITTRIAAAHNKSTAELALKWLVANGIPLAVQSTNPKHLASDIDLWSWDLTEEEMTTLDAWVDNSTIAPSWCCGVWDVKDVPFLA